MSRVANGKIGVRLSPWSDTTETWSFGGETPSLHYPFLIGNCFYQPNEQTLYCVMFCWNLRFSYGLRIYPLWSGLCNHEATIRSFLQNCHAYSHHLTPHLRSGLGICSNPSFKKSYNRSCCSLLKSEERFALFKSDSLCLRVISFFKSGRWRANFKFFLFILLFPFLCLKQKSESLFVKEEIALVALSL